MKPLNRLQRFVYWLYDKFYYNCEKGRHKWCYLLSEAGIVYLDDSKVPDSAWHCSECGEPKYKN